jgi:FkbM family methyltransferase
MQQVVAKPPGIPPFPFFVHDSADRYISARIRTKGVWEPFESRLLLGLLNDGDQLIDVGANIGWYTVSAARRVGEHGQVFAFEPDANNFAVLSANVRAGAPSCITLENKALGRTAGAATMEHSQDNQGDHRLRAFNEGHPDSPAKGSVSVVSLDTYLAGSRDFKLEKLRVLKIDVQGFEAEVLRGARELLSRLSPYTVIFIEFEPALLKGNGPNECNTMIEIILSTRREVFAIARPLWRLVRVDLEDLQNTNKVGLRRSHDLVVAHPDSVSQLNRAMPGISRLMSRRDLLPYL